MFAIVTTLLDALGLLLWAAGATAALFPYIGWAALTVGGTVILAGSAFAAWRQRPAKAP